MTETAFASPLTPDSKSRKLSPLIDPSGAATRPAKDGAKPVPRTRRSASMLPCTGVAFRGATGCHQSADVGRVNLRGEIVARRESPMRQHAVNRSGDAEEDRADDDGSVVHVERAVLIREPGIAVDVEVAITPAGDNDRSGDLWRSGRSANRRSEASLRAKITENAALQPPAAHRNAAVRRCDAPHSGKLCVAGNGNTGLRTASGERSIQSALCGRHRKVARFNEPYAGTAGALRARCERRADLVRCARTVAQSFHCHVRRR